MQIQSSGKSLTPVSISIYGEYGCKNIIIKDTFFAFKKSLIQFKQSIINKESDTKFDELIKTIELVELGIK